MTAEQDITLIRAHSVTSVVHAAAGDLGWCGMRPQFRHRRYQGPQSAVTCKKCLAALNQNQPRAWRS